MVISDAPFRIEEPQTREVARLVDDRLLDLLLPGVAGPVGSARDAHHRVAAAALALSTLPPRLRERGVVAQDAAAWVWCGGVPPGVLDLVVPPHTSVPRIDGVVRHERRMPEQDIAMMPSDAGPVAVTTATRTLVDLLRLHLGTEPPPAAPLLAHLPGVTLAGVEACLARMPRARGVTRARRLADQLPLAHSIRLPVMR
jgi:hypothetical protein